MFFKILRQNIFFNNGNFRLTLFLLQITKIIYCLFKAQISFFAHYKPKALPLGWVIIRLSAFIGMNIRTANFNAFALIRIEVRLNKPFFYSPVSPKKRLPAFVWSKISIATPIIIINKQEIIAHIIIIFY